LLGSFGGGSGVEESNGAAAQRRQPSSIPTMAARTRVLASGEAAASVQGLGGVRAVLFIGAVDRLGVRAKAGELVAGPDLGLARVLPAHGRKKHPTSGARWQ